MSEQEFWEAGGLYRGSTHPVVELFARQRIGFLVSRGVIGDVRSLLDVGAGSGFSSMYYPPGVSVVASDHAAGMLAGNRVRRRLVCSAYHLPFADARFDAVTCWELLHHLDEPAQAVREMLRVARRKVIIFEPNRINPGHLLLALARKSERRSIRFSPRYLRGLVREAGGRITLHVRGGLLFPNVTPLAVARLLSRLPYRVPLMAISQLVVAERLAGTLDRPGGPQSLRK